MTFIEDVKGVLSLNGIALAQTTSGCESADSEEPPIYTVALDGNLSPPGTDLKVFLQEDDVDGTILLWYEKSGEFEDAGLFTDGQALIENIQFLFASAARASIDSISHILSNPILR